MNSLRGGGTVIYEMRFEENKTNRLHVKLVK